MMLNLMLCLSMLTNCPAPLQANRAVKVIDRAYRQTETAVITAAARWGIIDSWTW